MGERELARPAAVPQELCRRRGQSRPDEGTLGRLFVSRARIDWTKLLSLLIAKGREKPPGLLYEPTLPDACGAKEERGMTAGEGDFERPPGGVVVPAPEAL
jgi:hypothetical protein